MSERIWYDDISNFITIDNYNMIMPSVHMNLIEKINTIVRFFLYFGIVSCLVQGSMKYMFFAIIPAIISIFIAEFDKKLQAKTERFMQTRNITVSENEVCTRPTIDNPFMNPTLVDVTDNPNRPPACSMNSPEIAAQIEENFHARLFRDVGDLYANMSSQREYYTVPATTIPNDQMKFAEWLYGSGKTCKEGNGDQCVMNVTINDPHRRTGATAADGYK